MTKMPAPMMAPIPSVTRLTGPRARLRLCSPVSPASFINVVIDFVANKGLPMQLLLRAVCARFPLAPISGQIGFAHCRGRACCAPTEKLRNSFVRLRRRTRPSRPPPIYRQAEKYDKQAAACGLCLIQEQDDHDGRGGENIEQWDKRIPERPIRPLRIGALPPQDKDSDDRQHVEEQDGENNVVQQIAVQVAVGNRSGRVQAASPQQNQDGDPEALIYQSALRY